MWRQSIRDFILPKIHTAPPEGEAGDPALRELIMADVDQTNRAIPASHSELLPDDTAPSITPRSFMRTITSFQNPAAGASNEGDHQDDASTLTAPSGSREEKSHAQKKNSLRRCHCRPLLGAALRNQSRTPPWPVKTTRCLHRTCDAPASMTCLEEQMALTCVLAQLLFPPCANHAVITGTHGCAPPGENQDRTAPVSARSFLSLIVYFCVLWVATLHAFLDKMAKATQSHAKPAHTRKRAPNRLLFLLMLLCVVVQAHGHQSNEGEVQNQPVLLQEVHGYTAKRNLRKAARRASRSEHQCATYKGQTYSAEALRRMAGLSTAMPRVPSRRFRSKGLDPTSKSQGDRLRVMTWNGRSPKRRMDGVPTLATRPKGL